jgi:hypothetical protein
MRPVSALARVLTGAPKFAGSFANITRPCTSTMSRRIEPDCTKMQAVGWFSPGSTSQPSPRRSRFVPAKSMSILNAPSEPVTTPSM